jgi:glycine hydroxymethyltransferase
MSIQSLIQQEYLRQKNQINLIASENMAYEDVLVPLSSCLNNKYAEGFPHKRYYGGCNIVDQIEIKAQEECNKVFGSEYANVQPHAGVEANLIAYKAFLNKGDTILAMDLHSGGHLSHSHFKHLVSELYNVETYGVDKSTYLIDYNEIEDKIKKHKPLLLVVGASAYSQLIDYKTIYEIAKRSNVFIMVDMAHIAGLVAASAIPSPIPYADIVTFTTHKTMRGPRGGCIVAKKEFQKNIERATIPGLQGGPFIHAIAAKALLFEKAQTNEFKIYQNQIIKNAKTMAHEFIKLGYEVLTNGTENHMVIINLKDKNITGKEAEEKLAKHDIIVNRNLIPHEYSVSPLHTTGIRLGTPFVTAQGMNEDDIIKIVQKINLILQ